MQAADAGAVVNDLESSSDDAPDSGDEVRQNYDSAPESDTFQNLEEALKEMVAKPVEPDVPPAGSRHGLELAELPAEQLDIKIQDTDKLTHVGRVTAVVDGIIVVKVCQCSPVRQLWSDVFLASLRRTCM